MTRSIINLTSPSEGSTKRNQRIRVEPIPDDLHQRVSSYASRHRYTRLMDALYYAADVGMSVLESAESVAVIKINNRL